MVAMGASSVSTWVAQVLRNEILEGRMTAGEHIRQVEVATRLNVSQSSVREAFGQLQSDGLVILLPRRGVRVAKFTIDDLRQIYQVRAVVEELVLRAAIPKLSAEHIDRLDQLVAEMDDALQAHDPGRFNRVNHEFHFVMLDAAGIAWAYQVLRILWGASAPYRALFATGAHLEATEADHRAMVDACRRGAVEEVLALQRGHRERTIRRLEQATAEPPGGVTRAPDGAISRRRRVRTPDARADG